MVTLLLVGVAVFAYVSPETFEGNAAPVPENDPRVVKGSSCDSLEAARLALEKGSNEQFVTSVRAAERAAIHALDTDFVWFGKPEELALRLGAEELDGPLNPQAKERLSARLELVDSACQKNRS